MTLGLLVRLTQRAGLSLQLCGSTLTVRGRVSAVAACTPELRRLKDKITEYLLAASNNGADQCPDLDDELYIELFEERASVLEFEAGMSRHVAEARSAMEVYSMAATKGQGAAHA